MDTVTLWHPELDREITVAESALQILSASGWVMADQRSYPTEGRDNTSDPDEET